MSHERSHDRHGKVVHRPCSSCISSIENLIGTLLSSLCQMLIKSSWLNFSLELALWQRTAKTSKFPKIVRVKWWDGTSPNHLATTFHFSNLTSGCHKLHLAISPSILQQFSQSQRLWKALKKTFQLMPVTSWANQYWLRY